MTHPLPPEGPFGIAGIADEAMVSAQELLAEDSAIDGICCFDAAEAEAVIWTQVNQHTTDGAHPVPITVRTTREQLHRRPEWCDILDIGIESAGRAAGEFVLNSDRAANLSGTIVAPGPWLD